MRSFGLYLENLKTVMKKILPENPIKIALKNLLYLLG